MLYFLLVFSPKKVSKHLCSYNRMSLVLIGCMKLDLFAMGAKILLAGFFFSLQHHDCIWQDICQS